MESRVVNNESEILSTKLSIWGRVTLTKGASPLVGQGTGSRAHESIL